MIKECVLQKYTVTLLEFNFLKLELLLFLILGQYWLALDQIMFRLLMCYLLINLQSKECVHRFDHFWRLIHHAFVTWQPVAHRWSQRYRLYLILFDLTTGFIRSLCFLNAVRLGIHSSQTVIEYLDFVLISVPVEQFD